VHAKIGEGTYIYQRPDERCSPNRPQKIAEAHHFKTGHVAARSAQKQNL